MTPLLINCNLKLPFLQAARTSRTWALWTTTGLANKEHDAKKQEVKFEKALAAKSRKGKKDSKKKPGKGKDLEISVKQSANRSVIETVVELEESKEPKPFVIPMNDPKKEAKKKLAKTKGSKTKEPAKTGNGIKLIK